MVFLYNIFCYTMCTIKLMVSVEMDPSKTYFTTHLD